MTFTELCAVGRGTARDRIEELKAAGVVRLRGPFPAWADQPAWDAVGVRRPDGLVVVPAVRWEGSVGQMIHCGPFPRHGLYRVCEPGDERGDRRVGDATAAELAAADPLVREFLATDARREEELELWLAAERARRLALMLARLRAASGHICPATEHPDHRARWVYTDRPWYDPEREQATYDARQFFAAELCSEAQTGLAGITVAVHVCGDRWASVADRLRAIGSTPEEVDEVVAVGHYARRLATT